MKKLIFILLFLLIPSLAWALPPVIFGSLQKVTAADDPCPTGTYLFAWNGDYTSDTDKGCFTSGSATKDGTQTGGTLSTDYGQVGVGFRKTAASQRILWAISGADGFNRTAGTLWMSVKVTDDGARTNDIVASAYVSGCDIRFYIVTDNTIEGYYNGETIFSTDTLTPGTWTRIAYAWDDTNNLHALKIGAGSWAEVNEAISCTADPTDLLLGIDFGTETDTIDMDNYYILSTYQAADPY